MQVKIEISSSLSSSRFYAVELNSIFGLSSSIQTNLTDELNRGESKLPQIAVFILLILGDELKKSRLSSSGVKLIFSIKTADLCQVNQSTRAMACYTQKISAQLRCKSYC